MDNWDHFQEELDHQHSNEYQFWLLNHHSKPCCYFDGDMAFLKYSVTNLWENMTLSHTLLDILHSTACHCDRGLQFRSRNNLIRNRSSQSSYSHWKPIRRVLWLGKDCEPNFYFFNKRPRKFKLFWTLKIIFIAILENAPNIYKNVSFHHTGR